MKINCFTENIEKHTSLLTKIIPLHSQVPIFSNVLIEANKDGFFLSTTDLDLAVRVKIPAKIEEEGSTTVPGKQFLEVINSLPKDKVSLKTVKDSFIVNCRGNKVSFQTIAREEFPTLFEKKGEKIAEFSIEDFKNIFSKIIFAASNDETRPQLSGVLLLQSQEGAVFVATDGYRLSLEKIKKEILAKTDDRLILSSRLINEVLLLKPEKSEISMYVLKEGSQILFESEDVLLVGRMIEGEFPNYERVIPKNYKTKLLVNREELLQSLRLSSVFARESANIVKIKIDENTLELSSKASGLGEGEIKIDTEKEGDNLEISFNVKFLLDFLRSIDSENIIIEANSGTEPCLFRLKQDNSFLHVIMPVRIQE